MLHKLRQTAANTPTNPDSALHLVPSNSAPKTVQPTRLIELLLIASRRCSAFFAEAAVLVLVFGILDYFMLKGRIELPWILGALAISIGLLVGSIAMDFTAHNWAKANP